MVGLSLPLEAVASGAAPQLLPGSASLGCQGARPTPGSRDGLSGHDRASTVGLLCLAGLGLPCPACLLYESPWVLDLRLGKGLHRPCPGCPPSPRRQPLGPAHSPAASWPYVGQTAGLVLSVGPLVSEPRAAPPTPSRSLVPAGWEGAVSASPPVQAREPRDPLGVRGLVERDRALRPLRGGRGPVEPCWMGGGPPAGLPSQGPCAPITSPRRAPHGAQSAVRRWAARCWAGRARG